MIEFQSVIGSRTKHGFIGSIVFVPIVVLAWYFDSREALAIGVGNLMLSLIYMVYGMYFRFCKSMYATDPKTKQPSLNQPRITRGRVS
jgi:hypothetical protein